MERQLRYRTAMRSSRLTFNIALWALLTGSAAGWADHSLATDGDSTDVSINQWVESE